MPVITSQSEAWVGAIIEERSAKTGEKGQSLAVQYNPESLKVTYANQVKRISDKGGALQVLGTGTSKLSVQLVFDGTADGASSTVLRKIDQLRSMMGADLTESSDEEEAAKANMGAENRGRIDSSQAAADSAATKAKASEKSTDAAKKEKDQNDAKAAKESADKTRADLVKAYPGRPVPLVAFVWGAFSFEGIIESLEQTLELFTGEGVPLRATVQLTLARQRLQSVIKPKGNGSANGQAAPGTTPLIPTPPGLTAQALGGLGGGGGGGAGWQSAARSLGVESPRHLPSGAWMDPRKLSGG